MRSFVLTVSAAALVFSTTASAQEQAPQPQVDYDSFLELTAEVSPYREARLLDREAFFAKAAQDGALLLDTRSAADFQMGHIEGAVNLPFSQFTDEKLREVIGDNPDRAVLIYCNNNFSDNVAPIMLKRAPLALNIPTFINLYGYGYKNVWELEGVMSTKDVAWTGMFDELAIAPLQQPAESAN